MKKTFTLASGFFFLFISVALSQSCNCSRTISSSGIYNGISMNVQPGEVICIQAGNYSLLRFIDFVGTENQPIIFKNCGGKVTISHNQYYGALDFLGSKHFKVTGTGSSDFQYGIFISGTGENASGLSVASLSSDCEIDHIEIQNTGFAGMLIKTDPSCDPNTWRSNFTMKKVLVHDNYVHNTGGEGLYIGSSFFNGKSINCNGQTNTVYPHLIEDLKIYNNLIENTGADGIQYSCAPQSEVYNNVVNSYGISPFEEYQNNGIQLGAGGGKCYGNKVSMGSGNGIQVTQPTDDLSIFNNLVVNSGKNSLFSDDRSISNINLLIANNTFVKSGQENIKIYGNLSSKKLYNNLLVEPPSNVNYVIYGIGAQADEKNNLKVSSMAGAFFKGASDYHCSINSPTINNGLNISSLNILNDLDGNLRPNGGQFDIGAYESQVNPPMLGLMSNQILSNNTALSFNVTAIDSDGEIPTIIAQNLPPFASFIDNGNGTATFSAIPQLQNQTFEVTFVASDSEGGFNSKSIQINLYASIPGGQQHLFRVNAGGVELNNSSIDFNGDTSNEPSPFTNVSSAASVVGTSVVVTNQTGLPNQVFQTFRRDSQAGDDMRWSFPVYYDASWYKVNLYFIESVSSANRVFNIIIEGNTLATNFNIKSEAGIKNAIKKSYNVFVSDGNLNLHLQRLSDNPLISAIEIISLGVDGANVRINYSDKIEKELTQPNISLYPNPAKDYLYLDINKLENEMKPNSIHLVDILGKTIWETKITDQTGPLNIPIDNLKTGLYELVLGNNEQKWVEKFVKQ